MSDNIPFEIQAEIMKRLPVKSLIQFRTVSKSWKSLIDSSAFIKTHSYHTQHLLIRYVNLGSFQTKHISIVDDHTFPRQRLSLTLPLLVTHLKKYNIIGCSYGLLCLFGDYQQGRKGPISGTGRVVLWNISIRKAVAVVVPNVASYVENDEIYRTVLGFGVCRQTIDPKIVKITCGRNGAVDVESVVEVFTLSTGSWRCPYGNLPRKSIKFYGSQIVDGCLYWLATDRINTDGGFKIYNLIISFDMISEDFKEINLPDDLAGLPHYKLSLSKVSESLVVVENGVEDVWMMEDGVPKSFTKVFSVNVNIPPGQVSQFRGFRKTGEPILEIVQHILHGQLVVYDPDSKHVDELEIDGQKFTFSVYPYMETLLLLDQPNLSDFRN